MRKTLRNAVNLDTNNAAELNRYHANFGAKMLHKVPFLKFSPGLCDHADCLQSPKYADWLQSPKYGRKSVLKMRGDKSDVEKIEFGHGIPDWAKFALFPVRFIPSHF